jgi:hypothetical protein
MTQKSRDVEERWDFHEKRAPKRDVRDGTESEERSFE